jgi:hypothetical protein
VEGFERSITCMLRPGSVCDSLVERCKMERPGKNMHITHILDN